MLYLPIVVNLTAAVKCTDQGALAMDPSLTCWQSPLHFVMVAVCLVGLAFYYPMASFLFPNLQFVNTMLDIK